jgi:hypothetical protein
LGFLVLIANNTIRSFTSARQYITRKRAYFVKCIIPSGHKRLYKTVV